MNTLPRVVSLYLLLQVPIALASVDSTSLVRVTKENNPQCIEYFTYKEALYCSTHQSSESKAIDPRIKDYETQNIVFDNRPWQAVWGNQSNEITTVEYVPAGDNIELWHELVTSQFIPGLQNKMTATLYVDAMVKQLRDSGFNPAVTRIMDSPNQSIFEFRITEPAHLKQDELQIVNEGKNGLYILHYVIKETDMGQANRERWLQNLQKSSIKQSNN